MTRRRRFRNRTMDNPPPPGNNPQKREGTNDPETLEEQPSSKRPASSMPVAGEPPAPVETTTLDLLQRMFGQTHQLFGLTDTELAQLFVRNEPALSTTVESLRVALQYHVGHLTESLENFRIALGPPQPVEPEAPAPSNIAVLVPSTPETPRVIVTSPSQEQVAVTNNDTASNDATPNPNPPPTPAPIAVTDRSGKEILRSLGRIFELHSAIIKKLTADNQTKPEDVDNKRIAYVIGQVMQQLGDILQYTFRSNLSHVEKNFHKQLAAWRGRIESIVEKVKSLEDKIIPDPEQEDAVKAAFTEILQTSPAIVYPAIQEPQLRYRINIAENALVAEPPQLILGASSSGSHAKLHTNEENLMLRFGSLDLVIGSKKTQIDYSVRGMNFQIYEVFNSNGWINPSSPKRTDGKFIRGLEFDLGNFQEGSEGYLIERRLWDSSKEQMTTIIVSGILKENRPTSSKGGQNQQRIEFAFVLPSFLGVNHVNDVGIRESVLKVQFAK